MNVLSFELLPNHRRNIYPALYVMHAGIFEGFSGHRCRSHLLSVEGSCAQPRRKGMIMCFVVRKLYVLVIYSIQPGRANHWATLAFELLATIVNDFESARRDLVIGKAIGSILGVHPY